ncbi:MAG: glycosyltransferase, partial [Acidobacteriota bacterium]
ENYLSFALYSVCNQTLGDLEILVVDDGSTDNSRKIAAHYAEKYSNLRLIDMPENTPGGAGIPSNAGIDLAQGEYIGFVDSDDWVEPSMFKKMYSLAKKHDADIVICDFNLFDEIKKEFEPAYDRKTWEKLTNKKVAAVSPKEQKYLLKLSPVPWRKIYRRDFVERFNIRYPEGDYFFEDNPLHWQALIHASSCVLLDEVLCYHRNFREGQTRNFAPERLLAFFDHFETVEKHLRDADLFEEYEVFFFEWIVRTDWIYKRVEGTAVEREMFLRFQAYLNRFPDSTLQAFIRDFKPSKSTLKRIENYRNGSPPTARAGAGDRPAASVGLKQKLPQRMVEVAEELCSRFFQFLKSDRSGKAWPRLKTTSNDKRVP